MRDPYEFKKYQAEWMTSDIKPKGRILKKIRSSARQKAKRAIVAEVKNGRSR
jgi:hypothetical protein